MNSENGNAALLTMDAIAKYIGDQTESCDESATDLLNRAAEARAAMSALISAATVCEEIAKPGGIRTASRRSYIASHMGLPSDATADAIRNAARLRLRAALARTAGSPK